MTSNFVLFEDEAALSLNTKPSSKMGGKKEKCKEGFLWTWNTFITATFEYDTAKIVHIKNKKVGFMNRLVQLGIIGYIIG